MSEHLTTRRRRPRWSLALALTACLGLAVPTAASAAGQHDRISAGAADHSAAAAHTGPDYNNGKALPLRRPADPGQTINDQPRRRGQIGQDVRSWLALNDAADSIYLKPFTLRGVGDHIEVWVANDLAFPEGDPRNGERTTITDAQVQYLISEFDGNIYPKESAAFSTPPRRNGSKAVLPRLFGPDMPQGYYSGEGDNIVVLVDNVKDSNYYDWADDGVCDKSYIAGFFYSLFSDYQDRNIMTIDAYDWLHRTTANPPNEPDTQDSCNSKPARPFLYEGVFAHEYQHLLEHYQDPDETTWVNEGLSDWAQTLTGYVDPSLTIDEQGYDSHIQCFLGWLGTPTAANPNPRDGGPENSLNLWGDQGDDEILCDYGAAYSMMEYLAGRFGTSFMTDLHRDPANGFDSLTNLTGEPATDVVHDWLGMTALDRVLDGGATLSGGDPTTYTTPTLDAMLNWDVTDAYDTPGAPPNGMDAVRLRDADGSWLGAGDLDSITFDGASTLPPKPIEWTVDDDGHATGDAALYSGSGANFDRAIIQSVSVPSDAPTLTFDTSYDTETGWDFGFVQVSTDGGATWTSLSNADTTSEHDPGAIAAVQDNLPGFTGSSGGWTAESFDLSDYAGQDVLVSFRYVTDSGVNNPGWWVDNVAVGGSSLSDGSTLDGWQSASQVHPTAVHGFTVQLVAYDDAGDAAWIGQLPIDATTMQGSLSGAALSSVIGDSAETVAALVTYDEPTESIGDYAPYTLRANGVTQPGGGA